MKVTIEQLRQDKVLLIGDQNTDIYDFINGFLQRSQMYYDEWFPSQKRSYIRSKKRVELGEWPKEESRYYVLKAEIERIMRERETMPDEELIRYIDGIIKKDRRVIYIYMLLIYLDFYSEDEEFEKELWEETMKYFKVTDQEIKNFRI